MVVVVVVVVEAAGVVVREVGPSPVVATGSVAVLFSLRLFHRLLLGWCWGGHR